MIKLGNNDITLKVGSADVSAAYLGSVLVYNPVPPEPKWIATYTGGTTSSAQCDVSSAITNNEITKIDLAAVEIGSCVAIIGNGAFGSCDALTSVTIPDSVTSIGTSAFESCSSLSSVTIPNSVTTIGNYAFQGCYNLDNIIIPSGVTSIGEQAFYGCYGTASFTCLATTPPTLGYYGFEDTGFCPIYVPSASVSTYQSASGWSSYASRIQAIPEPSPQWVDYASGEIIPTDLDIYGVSGTADSLCTTFSYVDDAIYIHLERNAVIADIGPGCYSGSYPMSGNIEITFSDVVDAGCSDSYRLNHASHVVTGVKLLIYQ